MQNNEIMRQQKIITQQDEIIKGLQEHITMEMKDNENNKNKLSTSLATVHRLSDENDKLKASNATFEDKYNNMEKLYTELSIEKDTLSFKFNTLNKDFMDNLIKMKLAIKTRQYAEQFNEKMKQRNNELEGKVNELNLSNSERGHEIENLRRKLKEQDYHIGELEDLKERMNISINKQNAHFDESIKKVEAHLKAERNNTKCFQQKFSEECGKHAESIKLRIISENKWIKLDLR